jgi:TRAP transporter 4TM/12TM fusion protein
MTMKRGVGERATKFPFSYLYMLVAVGFALTYLYIAYRGPLDLFLHRSLFLLFAVVLIFLRYRLLGLWGRSVDFVIIGLALVTIGNIVLNHAPIAHQAGVPTPAQVYLGVLLLLIVFEASRRTVGLVLPFISILAIAYAYFGKVIPGIWGHGGFSFQDIIGFLYITHDGLWSFPLGVAATYIFVFIILGAFLMRSGLSEFFNNLSLRLIGGVRGGPAQVAIWGSAAFGTISGAAPANVVVTGSVTIPLMKRMGFSAKQAAAVECAASAGGQIMPPVMGAAIFIMIELIGVSYGEVIKAAFIPALLYFLGIAATVYFLVSYLGFKGLSRREIDNQCPPLLTLLRRSYLLLPLLVLVLMVFQDIPLPRAAFYTILFTIGIAVLFQRGRFRLKDIGRSLIDGAENTLAVAMGVACASLIYGVVVFTGLGVKFSTLAVQATGENALLLLIVSALATLVLGAALPTVAAYLITAATMGPALIAVGIDPLAAHLFIFYYAVLATITPPMGLALYTAAGLAGAGWLATGLQAMKLVFSGLLVPFAFVYMPGLLMEGPIAVSSLQVVSVVLGVISLSAGLTGYLFARISLPLRAILILAAASLFHPNLLASIVGALTVGIISLFQWRFGSRKALREGRGKAYCI